MRVLGQFRFISKAVGEAATTAARHTPCTEDSRPTPPASPTARAASASVDPVVNRSSTRITLPSRRSPCRWSSCRWSSCRRSSCRRSRPPPAVSSSAPARFARRCRAPRPDWSATARRCLSSGRTWAGRPARRRSRAAAAAILRTGSWPRAAVEERAEGTGTSSRGPASPGRPAPARTQPARARPSAPASPSAPRSLWASRTARTAFSYGADAYTAGSPGGRGEGRTRRAGAPCNAAPQAVHSSVRGLPQPAQATGRSRPDSSCHARHAFRMTPQCRDRRNRTTPVDNPLGTTSGVRWSTGRPPDQPG